ncbi:MAG: hypothetical protein DMD82_11750 [Candidatus Rokuibacteriota bacterium]|nr:MAG: hypothetical protein DMD82_11750 [Candidatus Rokubacteria bacterium]
MRGIGLLRRHGQAIVLTALGLVAWSAAHAAELKVPDTAATTSFDFDDKGIGDFKVVDGQWVVEEMAGAPSGKRVLVQRAIDNVFNVIVAPAGPYSDVDASVRFKPVSGREDASGGIVFRFNFRLYYYDHGRYQLASARVYPPSLGQWHTMRVVAVGDHIQGYLDGKLLIDHRDARYRSGKVGLWTKADSVTAFDDLVIRGVPGGGGG